MIKHVAHLYEDAIGVGKSIFDLVVGQLLAEDLNVLEDIIHFELEHI